MRACKSGYRFREAGRKFSSTGYKRIAVSEFHDFCEIFTVGEKIAPLPGRHRLQRAGQHGLGLRWVAKLVEPARSRDQFSAGPWDAEVFGWGP